jgi:phosphonopyruvate decarboxylase
MIDALKLLDYLKSNEFYFYTGVPDSQLQSLCFSIYKKYGTRNKQHIVAVNEGNAVALAAGYHLATNKIPVVYMQNSGLGNAVNPISSLTDPSVYGIPIVYFIGWRGEPDLHDEPQHFKQGSITLELLDSLGIIYIILDKNSSLETIKTAFKTTLSKELEAGKSVAFVVRKGAFDKVEGSFPLNKNHFAREYVIRKIVDALDINDQVISTTGKISRELFEYRKTTNSPCKNHDFLTVGSMGHASAIALSIALHYPGKTIWCFDGDGAALMHMGSLAIIGDMAPKNFIHIVFNNMSHESVGGMPTIADTSDFCGIASASKYRSVRKIVTQQELDNFLLLDFKTLSKPAFVEIMVQNGSRSDLIRPDTTPQQNKKAFMESLI